MNKEDLRFIVIVLVVSAALVWFGYMFGHTNGRSEGWNAANELEKKIDCQVEWGNKPNSEVPVKCLKYLQEEL